MEQSLIFSDIDKKRPVIRLNGRATSTLRGRRGVNALKNREESDLHNALDACVAAAATNGMIKRISEYSKTRELGKLQKESQKGEKTLFPEPWPRFRKEIEARLSPDPAEK